MFALLLASAIAANAAAQPALPCEPGDGIPLEYCQLMQDGIAAVRDHRFREATALLERALRVPLFEVPNYDVTGYVALAYCASGDTAKGASFLRDFECMLSVDAGELRCNTGASTAPVRGPGLTDRCYEAMCGELYLAYYEDPTANTLHKVQRLRRQAKAIRQECEP